MQIACLLRCVYGRDDRDLATVMEPHRTDQHTGSDKLHPDDFQMRCFLLLASCKFWIARFIAGIRMNFQMRGIHGFSIRSPPISASWKLQLEQLGMTASTIVQGFWSLLCVLVFVSWGSGGVVLCLLFLVGVLVCSRLAVLLVRRLLCLVVLCLVLPHWINCRGGLLSVCGPLFLSVFFDCNMSKLEGPFGALPF